MIRKPILVPRKPILDIPTIMKPNVEIPFGYIYITTNECNGKRYIGKHSHSSFDKHYYGSGTVLNNAIRKYGIECFSVRPIDWASSKDELNQKEIWWIDLFHANYRDNDDWYNILGGGEGFTSMDVSGKNHPLYGKPMPDNIKQKISETKTGVSINLHHTQEFKERMRNLMLNKKFSEETLRKMSENHADFSGSKNPMYGVHRYGKTNPNAKKIVQLSLDNELVKIYDCMKDARLDGFVSRTIITKCCLHKQEKYLGYKWMYLQEYLELKDKEV